MPMNNLISSDCISVVVQGAIIDGLTANCLKSIRKYLPNAEIILSSWKNSNVDELDYDKCILSQDPGFFYYTTDSNNGKLNNINRQIVSTLSGIRLSKKKYILKIRTDFSINGLDFFRFVGKFPLYEENYKIFQQKILACSSFTRNPHISPYSYHPSDVAFFGLTDDILNLFDIPLMPKNEEKYCQYNGFYFNRYVPEQYLLINCARKNGKTIFYDNQFDSNSNSIVDTERFFASNFIFLSWDDFNLEPAEKFRCYFINDYSNIITHIEWKNLYKKYIDKSIKVSQYDIERINIQSQYGKYEKKNIPLKIKIYRAIAKLITSPIIGKKNKKNRHKGRNLIIRFLESII